MSERRLVSIRRCGAALVGVAALASALVLAPSAQAVTGNQPGQPFYANLVGSPAADRITVGQTGSNCTITVAPGKGNGTYGPAIAVAYKLPASAAPYAYICPDLGAALNVHRFYVDLALTWFSSPGLAPNKTVLILRNFWVINAGSGEINPSTVGTADFNGDGSLDLWETTDEHEGFSTFIRSGDTFTPGKLHFDDSTSVQDVSFGNLDGQPGADVASTFYINGPSGVHGALVGFGASGVVKILEQSTDVTEYATALLDANGDGFTDVEVSGGPTAPRVYLNDGAGNFTLASPAVAAAAVAKLAKSKAATH